MSRIDDKADLTPWYTSPTPAEYLMKMSEIEYQMPEYALHYFRFLMDRLLMQRPFPLRIVDICSSYAINTTLLQCNLRMDELTSFFLDNGLPKIHNREALKAFYFGKEMQYKNCEFFLADSSEPAMQFAKDMGLCTEAFCLDLRGESFTPEFSSVLEIMDLCISTGGIGYVGERFFPNALRIIAESSSQPIFAFFVYRAFYSQKIDKLFEKYDYQLIKGTIPLKKARRFVDRSEQNAVIQSLQQMNIDTRGFEEDGYYAADFYLGAPKVMENQLQQWLLDVEKLRS